MGRIQHCGSVTTFASRGKSAVFACLARRPVRERLPLPEDPMTTSFSATEAQPTRREKIFVALMALVQFVNILDAMMVMPMGPDFAAALGIDLARVGDLGAAYTGAAALSGLASTAFLDRFDRRPALVVALLGLSLATASGALATDLTTLVIARAAAGAFGGPAAALAIAIVADVVPPRRRGRAMAIVMGSFAIAAVLGVPFGLELAEWGGWTMPFLAVGAIGLVATAVVGGVLPSMTAHIGSASRMRGAVGELLRDPVVIVALLCTALTTSAIFALVPNISGFVQHNLGYPREKLSTLYLVGGTLNLAVIPIAGRLSDRIGAASVNVVGTVVFVVATVLCFLVPPLLPVVPLFALFMMSNGMRMVPLNALFSRVPAPERRASFMSANSAVQHFASALGAGLAARFLVEGDDGRLLGMRGVAMVCIAASLGSAAAAVAVERGIRRRPAGESDAHPDP